MTKARLGDGLILDKRDEAFVEKYVSKVRVAPTVVKRRPHFKRTPEAERLFRRMYNEGMSRKHISYELSISITVLDRWRVELGLPKRRDASKARYSSVNVRMNAEWLEAVNKRAFGTYRSAAEYVRSLIKRDLGL